MHRALRFKLLCGIALWITLQPADFFLCRAQTPSTASLPSQISLSAPAVVSEKISVVGVPNAGKVGNTLYRGAQPTPQGFAELKKLGVTTIVNLREANKGGDRERSIVEGLSMRYVNISVRGWSSPSRPQVAQFLELFRNLPDQKVFVHCLYGEDRTGVMVATYRIAEEKWSAEQAIKEMYAFGFHFYLYPGMKSFVRKFPAAFVADSTFASFRAGPPNNPVTKQAVECAENQPQIPAVPCVARPSVP